MILVQSFHSAGELQHHNPMHSSMWNRNWLVDHISLRIWKLKLSIGVNVIFYFSPETLLEELQQKKKEHGRERKFSSKEENFYPKK